MRRIADLSNAEAITSLGETAAETALLLRAGINNVGPSRFVGADGERIQACASPALPSDLPADDRLVALAAHALAGVASAVEHGLASDASRHSPVIVIALPERCGFGPAPSPALSERGHRLIEALRAHLPEALRGATIEAVPNGRAAGALALRRALQWTGPGRLVVWGGVDSYLDWPVLEALEAADRLVTVDNIDGVRPGEAAAFAQVSPPTGGASVGLLGLGLGREPQPIGSGQPSFARGMTSALDAALAPLRKAGLRTNHWWFDSNHEAYATEALQNSIARFGDVLGLDAELNMPFKELGDVGAAAMPLLTILGGEAWRLGDAVDRTAVVVGASDDGARGAMLLDGPTGIPRLQP